MKCALCQSKIELQNGVNSLKELPKNLYIDSILRLVEGNVSPTEPKAPNNRCAKCLTFLQDTKQRSCQHCMQVSQNDQLTS